MLKVVGTSHGKVPKGSRIRGIRKFFKQGLRA